METKKLIGYFVRGQNKAHLCCNPHTTVFGCKMYGTFNIVFDGSLLDYAPSIVTQEKSYWFVKISQNSVERFGWAIRDHTSHQSLSKLEILTKNLLSDDFKTGPLEVIIFQKWNEKEIKDWAKEQYWFQTFPFSPKKRADSELLWNTINNISWSGKKVLDIGSHYGYLSFKASELGAQVIGFEPNKSSQNNAEIIRDNIIHQDVTFVKDDPGGEFDIILFLSIMQQIDKNYKNLKQKINELKNRTKEHLFVELILPPVFPVDNSLTEEDIDKIVDAEILLKYKHKVRGDRKVYKWSNNVSSDIASQRT
jgi:SAM-dependent methyltransferase